MLEESKPYLSSFYRLSSTGKCRGWRYQAPKWPALLTRALGVCQVPSQPNPGLNYLIQQPLSKACVFLLFACIKSIFYMRRGTEQLQPAHAAVRLCLSERCVSRLRPCRLLHVHFTSTPFMSALMSAMCCRLGLRILKAVFKRVLRGISEGFTPKQG